MQHASNPSAHQPSRHAAAARTLGLTALLGMALLTPLTTAAQTSTQRDSSINKDQVVVPEVDRRNVRLPRIASKDFELGPFVGTYAVQNFGSSVVYGLRAGYHITEDYFAEATLGQTKVSDDTFRQILPGGIFANKTSTLRYANLSVGVNVLPGEVFMGKGTAKATAVYLLGGVGSTHFNEQRRQTFNLGLGMRLYLQDRVSMRVDLRDHIFSLDLLGKRERTQNVELTAGISVYF